MLDDHPQVQVVPCPHLSHQARGTVQEASPRRRPHPPSPEVDTMASGLIHLHSLPQGQDRGSPFLRYDPLRQLLILRHPRHSVGSKSSWALVVRLDDYHRSLSPISSNSSSQQANPGLALLFLLPSMPLPLSSTLCLDSLRTHHHRITLSRHQSSLAPYLPMTHAPPSLNIRPTSRGTPRKRRRCSTTSRCRVQPTNLTRTALHSISESIPTVQCFRPDRPTTCGDTTRKPSTGICGHQCLLNRRARTAEDLGPILLPQLSRLSIRAASLQSSTLA